MLTQLSLGNFKSWECIDKMRFAPITGLFGTNSSGKTSILQLLLMLKQTIESSDRAQVLEFGDEKSLTNLGSFRDAVYLHKKPGTIDFSLDWTLSKKLQLKDPQSKTDILFEIAKLAFQCTIGENGADRLSVSGFSYAFDEEAFRLARKGQAGSQIRIRQRRLVSLHPDTRACLGLACAREILWISGSGICLLPECRLPR